MSDLEHRQYVRHRRTGDLGYLVPGDDGQMEVRLDRAAQDIRRKYTGDWKQENLEDRKYTRAQVAKVAFELDVALCRMLNLYDLSKRSWIGLRDAQRIQFIKDGPAGPKIRQELWAMVMDKLGELAK